MSLAIRVLGEHGAELHTLLLRLTLRGDAAEELIQELFVRLSSSRAFANSDHPAAYARRVAINLAMDWRRQRVRRFAHGVEGVIDPKPGAQVVVEDADEVARILDATQHLSELARQAFVLRYVQQESYERVGEIIGKTAHQARGVCHLAVRTIRQKLEQLELTRERVE